VLGLPGVEPVVTQRRLGDAGKLNRLFKAVERREISADEATQQALRLFAEKDLDLSISAMPRLKKQLFVEFKDAFRSGYGPFLPKPKPKPLRIQAFATNARPKIGLVAQRNESTGMIELNPYHTHNLEP
jgi:hypothetical protein